MDEDPLPNHEEFKKDYKETAKILIGLLFWSLVFTGLFLFYSIAFAHYALLGLVF